MKRLIFFVLVSTIFTLPTLLMAQIDTSWVRRYNDPNNGWDIGTAITHDRAGNVYVAGQVTGNGDDYYVIKYGRSGNIVWASQYNGPGNNSDVPKAIAIDTFNNVYVTGECEYGDHAIIVTIKYNSSGDTLWTAAYYGGGQPSLAFDLKIDNLGNTYITGRGYGISSNAVMTIKYDSQGNEQWEEFYEGEDGYSGEGHSIAIDSSGYIYVGGASGTDSSSADFIIIKYTPNGDTVWTARYNSSGNHPEYAIGLALDNLGNIYATGPSQPGQSNDTQDILTIKYNSSGVFQWLQRYNGPANHRDYPSGIVNCPNGNICVTGFSIGSGTYEDYVTICYSPDSTQNWVSRYDGPAHRPDITVGMATDFMSNVYVTGYSLNSSFNNDYATIKYNAAGAEQWVMRYNGPDNQGDLAYAISTDSAGNVYVTGYSSGAGTSPDILTIKYGVDSQGIEDGTILTPNTCILSQNYPNPFNPTTTIQYDLPKPCDVSLEIFDILGHKIEALLDAKEVAGHHSAIWDGTDRSSGIYFYRIKAGDFIETRKMLFLK